MYSGAGCSGTAASIHHAGGRIFFQLAWRASWAVRHARQDRSTALPIAGADPRYVVGAPARPSPRARRHDAPAAHLDMGSYFHLGQEAWVEAAFRGVPGFPMTFRSGPSLSFGFQVQQTKEFVKAHLNCQSVEQFPSPYVGLLRHLPDGTGAPPAWPGPRLPGTWRAGLSRPPSLPLRLQAALWALPPRVLDAPHA